MNRSLPLWYRLVVWFVVRWLAWRKSPRVGPWKYHAGKRVWIHAASLGECKASLSIARSLPKGIEPVLTSTTQAGLARLREERPDLLCHLAPIDDPVRVGKFVNAHGISRVLLVEAEVWPGWIALFRKRKIPVALVTVRVSGRSRLRWRLLWKLFPWIPQVLDTVWSNTGEQVRAQEAGFLHVTGGASLKWAGCHPFEVPPEPGRHAAVSLHRRDAAELSEFVQEHPGRWLFFPRRLKDVAFWTRWAKLQGYDVVDDPSGLEHGQAWIAPAFGLVTRLVPGCDKVWVSPGHDAWEPLFLGADEVHPGKVDRNRLDAYQARVEKCLAEVVDWLRAP